MKAMARVPPSLRGCASFSPDMGFVQPGSFFEFGLRFRPDPECLARCVHDGWGVFAPVSGQPTSSSCSSSPDAGRAATTQQPPPRPMSRPDDHQVNDAAASAEDQALVGKSQAHDVEEAMEFVGEGRRRTTGELSAEEDGGAGMIVIPMRVDVPGQALPARSVLRARLTGWKVEVGCGGEERGGEGGDGDGEVGTRAGAVTVSFGPCFVGQTVVRRVSLRSTSLLPVKFGFVGNLAEVERNKVSSLHISKI